MAKPSSDAAPAKDANIATLHPPYFEMISEAILTLKERTGSSQPAIAKVIEDKYKSVLPPNFKKLLSVQLKKFVESERLVKVKNSYKIPSTEKINLSVKYNRTSANNKAASKKDSAPIEKEKAGRTKSKRLSQVKTPDALKKEKHVTGPKKMKRLSQVETPDGLKAKKKREYREAALNLQG